VKVIEKYLQSTHAPTHSDFTMNVLDIFSVDRDGESGGFLSDLHNRSAETPPLVYVTSDVDFED